MREPARAERRRGLQRRRSRLLVQRRGAAPEATQGAAETEAADDDGRAAAGLQGGAARAGREALTRLRFCPFVAARRLYLGRHPDIVPRAISRSTASLQGIPERRF